MKLSDRFADRKWLDSLHQLQHALHLPWDADEQGAMPSGRLVLAVTLVSVAAALVLVVAP